MRKPDLSFESELMIEWRKVSLILSGNIAEVMKKKLKVFKERLMLPAGPKMSPWER